MTTYYVGSGGNDGNDGLSWANRKLTLNGAEDVPVVAGDTVYVGPGTYREQLTVDVSGSSGNLISYIGDYTGANTDGTGGVVRITGSNDDITTTRSYCISADAKNYRSFQGFAFDLASSTLIYTVNACTHWTVKDCYFSSTAETAGHFYISGTSTNWTLQRNYHEGTGQADDAIRFIDSSTSTHTSGVVENSVFNGCYYGVRVDRVDGFTIKNCSFLRCYRAVYINIALAGGNNIDVNNCIFYLYSVALRGTVSGEIVEDYNALYDSGSGSARQNTATGGNSNTYPMLPDTRWFFEAAMDTGTLVTPFDLASDSPLVELNDGTGAPSDDLRGTSRPVGTYKEWGALEYDSTLDIAAGSGVSRGVLLGNV